MKRFMGLSILFLPLLFVGAASPETLEVKKLSQAPRLDGDGSDWAGTPGFEVPVKGASGDQSVILKVGYFDDTFYWLATWKDSTKDDTHKTFSWDKAAGKYVTGKDREDRFAVSFGMDGDFDASKLSGKEFRADVWHWKAARSNPVGLAHDKMWIISRKKLQRAREWKAADGQSVWLARPSDSGSKLYKSKRYTEFAGQSVPKYIVSQNVSGSVADVKAKGDWKDGVWTLEMARKLDTGHADDVTFEVGRSYQFSIAVFDHRGDDKHSVSAVFTLTFNLNPA